MWPTSLPCDLLIDIFRRSGSTSVIRCAGVCRQWRRTIIDNASCLLPRPDRFLPDLLLAFLNSSRRVTFLGHAEDVAAVGPSEAERLLAMESVMGISLYERPLAMRDGFILLEVRGNTVSNSRLCLCNLVAGTRRILPAAALGTPHSRSRYSYVLITAYDDDGAGGSLTVRILATVGMENAMTYRIFSTISGVWGPVKRSAKFIEDDVANMYLQTEPQSSVVCGGGSIVYWLVIILFDDSKDRICLFAMDMRTERTWIVEVPEECELNRYHLSDFVLATSNDGCHLYLIVMPLSWPTRPQINVWVLVGDSQWTLQQTVDLQSPLNPCLPGRNQIWLRCFCPRSGYLLVTAKDSSGVRQQCLIGVDGSPSRQVGRPVGYDSCFVLPYEMDWSTYISKMKYF